MSAAILQYVQAIRLPLQFESFAMAQKERARAEKLHELDSIFDSCDLLLHRKRARAPGTESDPAIPIIQVVALSAGIGLPPYCGCSHL